MVVHQLRVTVFFTSWMGAHAVDLLKQGIGGVAVGIHNEELVESPILGTAEEGALFSLLLKTVKLSLTIHTKLVLTLQTLTVHWLT